MSIVTKNLSKYVKDKGFNLAKMSRDTGIPYPALYCSLFNDGKRSLRDNELIAVCRFIGVNPMDFADSK